MTFFLQPKLERSEAWNCVICTNKIYINAKKTLKNVLTIDANENFRLNNNFVYKS